MADGIVQLPADGSGKKRDSSELTVGGNTVERERIVIASPTTAAALVPVKNVYSGTVYGLISRPITPQDNGFRTPVIFYADEVNSKGTTEGIVSMTVNKGGIETTAQTTYTVTTGKTLRIQAIIFSVTIATTTGGQKKGSLRLRADPSAVVVTSPVYLTVVCGSNALVAVNEGTETSAVKSDGLEFPSGWQVCLTEVGLGTASRTLISFCVVGFEY